MTEQFRRFKTGYWEFYLELEDRVQETRRFVEFDEFNHKTYSSNYLMLFQNICSEIDVVGKEIAVHFNPDFESENGTKPINRWWYEIQDQLPDISREILFAEKISVNPWSKFRTAKTISYRNSGTIEVVNYNPQKKTNGIIYSTPKWWSAYNKVKHQRLASDVDGVINFKKANFQNLVNAFAALYLLEFEFMKKIGTVKERIRYEGSVFFGMGDLQNHFIDSMFVNGETLEFGNSKMRE